MAIFILEDSLIQLQAIKELIESTCIRKNIKEEAYCFTGGRELLTQAKNTLELNIFFLDIQLKDNLKGGLEISKEIRSFDTESIIVFVTTHSELAMESYQFFVSALTFIEKNQEIDSFTKALDETINCYIKKKQKNNDHIDAIFYQTKTSQMRFLLSDIYFFETIYDHRIRYHGESEIREFFGTLKEIGRLDARLFRIHQSYLINPNKIQSIDKSYKEVVLLNGTHLPISRGMYKKVCNLVRSGDLC